MSLKVMSSRPYLIWLSIHFPNCMASCQELVQLQRMLLDLDRRSADWNFNFDLETQVGAPCSPDIRFQQPSFGPVFIAGHPQLSIEPAKAHSCERAGISVFA